MQKIKIFKEVKRAPAVPSQNLPERYALTTPEFRELYDKRGVYLLFLGSQQSPIYIGRAVTNLGKTIARHFQKWDAKELKFVERRPDQLLKMFVAVEEMPNASDDDIINRETDLIDKYKPTYNIRKGADAHKDPDRYELSQESRAALDYAVEQYEAEQQARAAYETALLEYERIEAERQAAEEQELKAAEELEQAKEQAAEAQTKAEIKEAAEEVKEAKEDLKEAAEEVKELEKESEKAAAILQKEKRQYKTAARRAGAESPKDIIRRNRKPF